MPFVSLQVPGTCSKYFPHLGQASKMGDLVRRVAGAGVAVAAVVTFLALVLVYKH